MEKFETYKNLVEVHYRQQSAAYLFNANFIEQYSRYDAKCYVNFPSATSEMQVENDVEALFGAIQTSCTVKSVKSIIAPFAQTANGIVTWKALYAKYGHHRAK